jgi:hypothetical protein
MENCLGFGLASWGLEHHAGAFVVSTLTAEMNVFTLLLFTNMQSI